MTRQTTIGLAIAIWALSLVPAVLAAMWFGLVEWSWLGALKAAVAVTVIVTVFELFERWVARRLAR